MFEGVLDWLASMPLDMRALGMVVAALLTLAVLSYVFGKNPVFDLAQYLFVGVAAGYGASLAWSHVLGPRARLLVESPQTHWYYGIFFALGLLLLTRGWRPIAALGQIPLGIMIGAGSGLALGGALTGSLVAQMKATVASVNPYHYERGVAGWAFAVDAGLTVLGTLAVLSAFHYTAERRGPLASLGNRFLRRFGAMGRKLLMVGFGALLAGAAMAFFAILQSRIVFLASVFARLIGPDGTGF